MGSRRRRWAALPAILALVAVPLAQVWIVPLPARLAAPPSTVVRWADGTPAEVFLAPDERWRLEADPSTIDPDYLRALLAYEDARFRWHPGVDPIAVARAAVQDLAAGRVVSGASTLTMQLVRVLEPRPRTLRSKAVEALRALQLELRRDKGEILAAYLTFVPYGRNLEGIEAASWSLFGHGPAELSSEEIVTLLAIPQDPNARYPRPRNDPALRVARTRVARRLVAAGVLGPDTDEPDPEALLERVATGPQPTALRSLPREIPHAARWMRTQLPEQTNVASTLGRGPQRIATAVLAAERTRLERKGVHNAAIVVVEHGSRSVVAMVGGHEGWGSEHGAWIAAFDVPRSPGSTLKPFLFARAIDRGLVLPGTRVPDVPTTHGGYTPRNYDGLFRGTVRLDHALSQSLNLPFVDLLAQVGVVDLVGLLRSAGAPSLSPDPSRYGLSLAVGGTEITPLELASLYTTLARDGKAAPLDWHGDRSATTGLPVLSPGATWLTTRVLAQRDRPDFPRRAELAGRSPVLRWKTGTSQGHRDAWAAGYGQRYTAVVWLGNLDGTASRALVGGELAAPVLFDLITALERNEGPSPGHDGAPPEDLVEVRVCPLSGLPVGPACPHAEEALALRSSVPTETCDLHRELEIDAASGERVEPGCRSGRVTRREVFVVEPPSVRRWKTTRGMAGATLPPMAKDCSNAASHAPPRILHPREGTVLVLLPDLEPTHQEQPLIAEADHPEPLWWFVDGRIVAHADADERAWWTPSPGRHELVVMATSGRADRRWVEVREGM